MPVYSSLFELNSSNVLIGTDFGIYTTKNLGANTTWTAENNGMGALPIMSIRQQTVVRPYIDGFDVITNVGAIYLASLGNGIFENRMYVGIDRPSIINNPKTDLLQIFPNPVSDNINFVLDLRTNENVITKLYDLRGNMIMVKDLGMLSKGNNKISIDAGNLTSGTYLMQVIAGSNIQQAKFVVIK